MEHINKFDKYNYREINMKRASGIIMHISSLPEKYGIGTFGEAAYDFVDFLKLAGQRYWQVLPLGPPGFGDSPYSLYSSFAGNPLFIDLEILTKQGYLDKKAYENIHFGDDEEKVDFSLQNTNKLEILELAFQNGLSRNLIHMDEFAERNQSWLENYALFMAIKDKHNGISWLEWEEPYKRRKKQALHKIRVEMAERIHFYKFIQYLFYQQFDDLKKYANQNGILLLGDLPIYVAEDSVEIWVHPELFLVDDTLQPTFVGGCPPDSFSETGQLWGNPVYNWARMEEDGYDWWINRIAWNLKLYDSLRLDHFRGFESFWKVPYGQETAVNGEWTPGPALKLFEQIKQRLGDVHMIVEDLGYVSKEVVEFRRATGFPGMKIIQFAFGGKEESDYMPHNIERNWVVYTGTHDNDTVRGWLQRAPEPEINYAIDYFKLNQAEGYEWGVIRGAWSTVADISIAQMQDFLCLDSEARMNEPSKAGCWQWRMKPTALTIDLATRIYNMTELYGRIRPR